MKCYDPLGRQSSIESTATRFYRGLLAMAVGIGAVIFCLGTALADSVSIRGSNAATPTVFSDVKITGVGDGKISFITSDGNTVTKDFITVLQIRIDDESNFDDAETEFSANHFAKAMDDYNLTMGKTDKPWLKAYVLPRLTDAANQAGRFDEAVKGYIALVQQQPAIAALHRPKVPAAGSAYLDSAAGDVTTAADAPGIAVPQQQALLTLLLEIQRARGDAAAVNSLGQRLTNVADADAALTSAALADAKISLAQQAIGEKDYDKAVGLIGEGKSLFTDSTHQADALYVLAEVAESKADAARNTDGLKDAAIAYFRVVADYKTAHDAPHVADSLLRAAGIFEKLNQPDNARQVYHSIVADYPKTAAADQAQQALKRLPATTQPG